MISYENDVDPHDRVLVFGYYNKGILKYKVYINIYLYLY